KQSREADDFAATHRQADVVHHRRTGWPRYVLEPQQFVGPRPCSGRPGACRPSTWLGTTLSVSKGRRVAGGAAPARKMIPHFAVRHQADQRLERRLSQLKRADRATIAKNGDTA